MLGTDGTSTAAQVRRDVIEEGVPQQCGRRVGQTDSVSTVHKLRMIHAVPCPSVDHDPHFRIADANMTQGCIGSGGRGIDLKGNLRKPIRRDAGVIIDLLPHTVIVCGGEDHRTIVCPFPHNRTVHREFNSSGILENCARFEGRSSTRERRVPCD